MGCSSFMFIPSFIIKMTMMFMFWTCGLMFSSFYPLLVGIENGLTNKSGNLYDFNQ